MASLFETGIFIKWKNNALPPDNECTTVSKPQAGDTRKIKISQIIGSFYILMFGLFGALGALLIEYIYITTKNKGRLPDVKGIQFKLFGYVFPSIFSCGKIDHEKKQKLMHTRMYPGMKDYSKSRKKRRQKMSHHMKDLHGTDNRGKLCVTHFLGQITFQQIF